MKIVVVGLRIFGEGHGKIILVQRLKKGNEFSLGLVHKPDSFIEEAHGDQARPYPSHPVGGVKEQVSREATEQTYSQEPERDFRAKDFLYGWARVHLALRFSVI